MACAKFQENQFRIDKKHALRIHQNNSGQGMFSLSGLWAWMSLCHPVASVDRRLSTIHKKCFSLNSYPISILFDLFERACACALTTSRISETLIINQLMT